MLDFQPGKGVDGLVNGGWVMEGGCYPIETNF